jgi:hypothetical protein
MNKSTPQKQHPNPKTPTISPPREATVGFEHANSCTLIDSTKHLHAFVRVLFALWKKNKVDKRGEWGIIFP